MKVTIEVSEEVARKISTLADPGRALEEALRWKEYQDRKAARMTPQVRSLMEQAERKAAEFEKLDRDELHDRLEAVLGKVKAATSD